MINLDSFGTQKQNVTQALDSINMQLSGLLNEEATFSIATQVSEPMLNRMLELEQEIFSIEDNVYSKEDILECLAEEYSLLLLLTVNGQIEGYLFGYDDDPNHPIVQGTDYFIDSAVISLAYQQKGIGTMLSGLILWLLYLLDFTKVGITTEEKDKTGRELVKLYQKLGFTKAQSTAQESVGMKIILENEVINLICSKLHLPK